MEQDLPAVVRRKEKLRDLVRTDHPIEGMRKAIAAVELLRDCALEAERLYAQRSKARTAPRRKEDKAVEMLVNSFISAWVEQLGLAALTEPDFQVFAKFMATVCKKFGEGVERTKSELSFA